MNEAGYTDAELAVMDARCDDYYEEVGCDGPDGCAECIARIIAAVRALPAEEGR